jgi:hypothetical protein
MPYHGAMTQPSSEQPYWPVHSLDDIPDDAVWFRHQVEVMTNAFAQIEGTPEVRRLKPGPFYAKFTEALHASHQKLPKRTKKRMRRMTPKDHVGEAVATALQNDDNDVPIPPGSFAPVEPFDMGTLIRKQTGSLIINPYGCGGVLSMLLRRILPGSTHPAAVFSAANIHRSGGDTSDHQWWRLLQTPALQDLHGRRVVVHEFQGETVRTLLGTVQQLGDIATRTGRSVETVVQLVANPNLRYPSVIERGIWMGTDPNTGDELFAGLGRTNGLAHLKRQELVRRWANMGCGGHLISLFGPDPTVARPPSAYQ